MPEFDRWADEFAAEWVRRKPQLATLTQYFFGAEQDALDRQLSLAAPWGSTYGAKAAGVDAAFARRGLDALARFPAASLTDAQQVSAAILEWNLKKTCANAEFAEHRFIFDQFKGLNVSLVMFLTALHPLRNARDAENYLARLALLPECLDEGIAEAQAAAAAGILPPSFILERTIEQLGALIDVAPADQVLVTAFARRLSAASDVPSERAAALVTAAEEEVRTRVLSAFGRVRALLIEQLTAADDAAGAWRLPDGKTFYALELAGSTSSSLSAQEIHAIGLREVARIEAEMDAVLKQLGYPDGPIHARVERLNEIRRLGAEDDARDEILAELGRVVKNAERRSESVFDLRPAAPVTVRREPAFSEKTSSAHYTPPAPDGSQPGVYWVPLADLSPRVPWLGVGLKVTAYHETIPGHHFQLAIQQESKELPRFRKLGAFGFDAAFGEGWALYSERLADENAWFDGDLPSRLGYLTLQLFRARRLVVDTGLHEMKWSRQQAIDYGFTVAEVERYVVWPGQACSYMIGMLRILELRERARARLGDRFSIKEFHNLVLGGGSMPLDVLSREIEAWAG